jgi:hypothetical protein
MAAVQRMMDYVKITAYIMVVMQGCRFYIGAREGCKLLSINRYSTCLPLATLLLLPL